jgi:hypothetical protein
VVEWSKQSNRAHSTKIPETQKGSNRPAATNSSRAPSHITCRHIVGDTAFERAPPECKCSAVNQNISKSSNSTTSPFPVMPSPPPLGRDSKVILDVKLAGRLA